MFAINKLFSNKSNENNQNEYVAVASMIEDGSVLDRRKPRIERRILADRRRMLANFYFDAERRLEKYRRTVSIRRSSDQVEAKNIDEIDALELDATTVNKLIREQMDIIEEIRVLSTSAKEMEIDEIKELAQKFSSKIKCQIKTEKHFVSLYLAKDILNLEEVGMTLSECYSDSCVINNQVLELLDKYESAEASTIKSGFFLLDMSIIHKKLHEGLDLRQRSLYPKYLA